MPRRMERSGSRHAPASALCVMVDDREAKREGRGAGKATDDARDYLGPK